MFRYLWLLTLIWACNSGSTHAQPPTKIDQNLSVATFAGGCFWCMETAFEGMKGIDSVVSGYMGGVELNPTYQQVSRGQTGHAEVVQVSYDPSIVSYDLLLTTFWYNIDPYVSDRQFCDRGRQYRPEIFVHTADQRDQANASVKAIKKRSLLKGSFMVPISKAGTFYPAEKYHQDYYLKNPRHYKRYRQGCGRDQRLQVIWGFSKDGKSLQKADSLRKK